MNICFQQLWTENRHSPLLIPVIALNVKKRALFRKFSISPFFDSGKKSYFYVFFKMEKILKKC